MNLFWLFCIYFGSIFIWSAEAPDAARYAEYFRISAASDATFSDITGQFYVPGTNNVDIAQMIINFLVSRLTNDPTVLFIVYATIFGYFYSRNIWAVLTRVNWRVNNIIFVFILVFVLLNPIWNINGFRMWTAAQIFFYGTWSFLYEGRPKNLLWIGLSPLFHFSFFFPVLIFLLFSIMKSRIHIYFWFFITTSFINELNLESIRNLLLVLPDVFQIRVESYTNIQYAERIEIGRSFTDWYILLSTSVVKWVVYVMASIVYFNINKIPKLTKATIKLFSFALLFYGWANLVSLIPSGTRFLTVASLFMFAFFILQSKNLLVLNSLSRYSLTFSSVILLLFILVSFRIGLDFIGISFFLGNPITLLFMHDTVPLLENIKDLIL